MLTVFGHRATGTTPSGAMPNFHRHEPHVLDLVDVEDQDIAIKIRTSAAMLNYYVRAFEAAMQLYEHIAAVHAQARSEFENDPNDAQADLTLEIVDGWVAIAGRDGALTLFNFLRTLDGLISLSAKLTKLVMEERVKEIGMARKKLLDDFPNLFAVRHAVAHSGERFESAEKTLEHTFVGPWRNSQMVVNSGPGTTMGSVLVDNLNQRVYSNTWDGQIVSYRLEEASVHNLAAVRDMVFDALTADRKPK